ncbi:sterol desaturase family protein, partial [Mycobacterium branderi]
AALVVGVLLAIVARTVSLGVALQVGWVAVLGMAELLTGSRAAWMSGARRRMRNVAFALVNHVLVPPVGLWCVHWLAAGSPGHGVGALPGYVGVPLAIVVFDFAGYWVHRFSHRSTLLWRFHQVHHLDEDFDFTLGFRIHAVDSMINQVVLVALAAALGIPAAYLGVFSTLAFFVSLFLHADIAIAANIETPLRWLIVTPVLHVAHHHDQIHDTDTNFGFVFPWWDRMFGTYNTRSRTPRWRIGLDYSHDLGFIRLLIQPFIPAPLKGSAPQPVSAA